jgi:signal transduction histidine kinase
MSPESSTTGAAGPAPPPAGQTPDPRAWLSHLRHELRTPLNAVLGYSEMLIEDLEAAEAGAPLLAGLRGLHAVGRRLLGMVNDLLAASRVEAEQPNLEPIAAGARRDLAPLSAELVSHCAVLLTQAEGGGQEDLLPELQKIDTAAKRLAGMVADLTRQAGAEPDEPGTDGAMPDEAGESPAPAGSELVEAGQSPGHLLVVDDNETNRDLLSRRLQRQGYSVAAAANGREALERLAAEQFDLVLLDIMMPEMDGYEVLERLKGDPELRHLPVIMISALDEIDSVVRCIEIGAEDYLSKPFNPVLLQARIGASLEKKRLRDRELQLYQELQENYKRLQELESLRDSLTGMVVHDLRTPLTSLLTGLQTMELMGELNADQAECLTMATQGGETLLGMINDLLDVSKMEEGSLQLERQALAAGDLIARAEGQVKQLAAERDLKLVVEAASDLPPVWGDEEKLRRTLVNLLGNAIKFTPARGAITIAARRADAEPAVLFSVADTGEGIPQEAFEKIFEKFGQVETRKRGRKMSTGLGLTFCKMVAEAHGGRIWVESELGQGSTFLFTLPVAAGD